MPADGSHDEESWSDLGNILKVELTELDEVDGIGAWVGELGGI